MAATLLSMAIGKQTHIHNSMWRTLKRHVLGQIKSQADLFKFVKAVDKAKKPAFEQQENALQIFLMARRYDNDTIQEYIQYKPLQCFVEISFCNYGSLLSSIGQLAYNHPNPWETGTAKAMLDYHSKKLLKI